MPRLNKKLQAIIDVLDYPKLLRTLGTDVDRGFVKELLFIKKYLGYPVNSVLDVGAAEGAYTRACQFVFPHAEVHAFEPIPESLEKLRLTAATNSKLHLHAFALGAEDKLIDFHRNEYSFSSSMLPMLDLHKEVFPFTQNEKSVTLPCRRLDSLNLSTHPPVLVKIDVQGAELEVIRGGKQFLDHVEVVQTEVSFEQFYEGQASYDEVIGCMKELGFRSFVQMDPQYSKTKPLRLYYCDLIFFR